MIGIGKRNNITAFFQKCSRYEGRFLHLHLQILKFSLTTFPSKTQNIFVSITKSKELPKQHENK